MESSEQSSVNNLEVIVIENDSIGSGVINIDRNKIEAIPKTNQVPINTRRNKINRMNIM